MNEQDREENFDAIIIGGLGHIGLPLGIFLAQKGLRVALYDINLNLREQVRKGLMPFMEEDADILLPKLINETLFIVDELEAVARSEMVFITIGTPIDQYMNARVEPVIDLFDNMAPYLKDGQLVVLRSTVVPGTTDLCHALLSTGNRDIDLAFCPERVVQGKMLKEMATLPQIVAGTTNRSTIRSRELFAGFGVETIVTRPKEAELAKLMCNAWRYIQFSIANQFYVMADQEGLEFNNIMHAMTHNYPRMQGFPSPGFAAGPCLMKDTMQLAAYSGNRFELGHAAMVINEGLAFHAVDKLEAQMNGLQGRTVGILGMGFKSECDDIRESLSYKIRKSLRARGAKVHCADGYVDNPDIEPLDQVLNIAEGVIIGAPHPEYKSIRLRSDQVLVDVWSLSGAEVVNLNKVS